LAADHLDLAHWGARIDFLATYAAEHIDGALIAKEFEAMLGCKVRETGLKKDIIQRYVLK
jgi:hypothetical protein